ncbi:hypothetical protein [uncultured Marinobacter sp.]|uniref:hypothetical protein n=1 Tax=uncultured Marinobacter sp. TaxID=187379 RepID=UPI0025949641|nr:hypothetical protein [uncultured Marinobacter sp.]
MWIVVAGNPMDGITFYGPFDDGNYANDWAEDELNNTGCDWWVSELTQPDQE